MAIYLVQHGLSASKDVDPEKGLTDQGRVETERIAQVAKGYGIRVEKIIHSGKRRAEQTAAIYHDIMLLKTPLEIVSGINPQDDVRAFARDVDSGSNVMVVGHMPFIDHSPAETRTLDPRRRIAMAVIYHELTINAPVTEVYEAISSADQIGRWWDKQTAIQTDHGLVLEHNPGPEHGVVKLRVVELVPNKRIEWECISVHPISSPASAWTGTRFIFELAESTDSPGEESYQVRTTKIKFHQIGYDERSGYFEFNRAAWREVLQNLKQVLESPRS